MPPWEQRGERWTTRAMHQWYRAAAEVEAEDRKSMVEKRQSELAKLAAASASKGAPRVIGAPSSRRIR